jgi:iron(II)-dependent oxidoreductase
MPSPALVSAANDPGATIAEAPPRSGWPDFALYRPHEPATTLARWLEEAHAATRRLFDALDDARLDVPLLPVVNPPLWELGHLAWFQEFWVHRRGDIRAASLVAGADSLYDSARVAHDARWTLPLPDRAGTWRYLAAVTERTLERLAGPVDDELSYFVSLCILHHDMHNEAFTYTWHTLGYPCPLEQAGPSAPVVEARMQGDVELAAARIELGAKPGGGFVFDNEKWAHEIDVPAFAIARRAVSNGEFLAFVQDGGYSRRQLWSEAGWNMREALGLRAPRYWREDAGRWRLRRYDRWLPFPATEPVMHVSWHEAQAYCAWARRRLPTEAEWQRAAAAAQLPASGAWEWTASRFQPFAGFRADPYGEYSEPWFAADHRVLKGGSFATPARLARAGFRNFFKPERADVFCGFRTCSLEKGPT